MSSFVLQSKAFTTVSQMCNTALYIEVHHEENKDIGANNILKVFR